MKSEIVEKSNEQMTTDEVATLLVMLYADYKCESGNYESDISKKYAEAVGIAIRMLTD